MDEANRGLVQELKRHKFIYVTNFYSCFVIIKLIWWMPQCSSTGMKHLERSHHIRRDHCPVITSSTPIHSQEKQRFYSVWSADWNVLAEVPQLPSIASTFIGWIQMSLWTCGLRPRGLQSSAPFLRSAHIFTLIPRGGTHFWKNYWGNRRRRSSR